VLEVDKEMGLKLAVCHDLLSVKGGAERVVLTVARAFRAEVFTLLYDPSQAFEEARGLKIHTLGEWKLPQDRRFYPWIYPFFHGWGILKFLGLDLRGYDAVFTSGKLGIFAKGEVTLHYCHSPPRFLYDLRPIVSLYLGRRYGSPVRALAELWWGGWRKMDEWAARRPDLILANSLEVKKRIWRYYGREAEVVYPPVKVEKFRMKGGGEYFLAVQRPSPEKRIELLLRIFKRLPGERLVLVGSYIDPDYTAWLEEKMRGMGNVSWLKEVSERELVELYAGCKALVHTARREDFGMAPVEAMASGKPVIAVNEGGVRETVVHGKTGLLVDPPYLKNFVRILRGFDPSLFSPRECRRRAEEFSEERFVRRMKELLGRMLG
ncbi:MAG: hypothetical protein DSO03_03675, partial [Hadesarchaea archaeon]